MTARPGPATSRSPSKVTIRATVEETPDGSAVTWSPGRSTPEAMVPANPRKSRSGRVTSWIGSRNRSRSTPASTSTVSRCSISGTPSNHGISSVAGSTTLAPVSADIGST